MFRAVTEYFLYTAIFLSKTALFSRKADRIDWILTGKMLETLIYSNWVPQDIKGMHKKTMTHIKSFKNTSKKCYRNSCYNWTVFAIPITEL